MLFIYEEKTILTESVDADKLRRSKKSGELNLRRIARQFSKKSSESPGGPLWPMVANVRGNCCWTLGNGRTIKRSNDTIFLHNPGLFREIGEIKSLKLHRTCEDTSMLLPPDVY